MNIEMQLFVAGKYRTKLALSTAGIIHSNLYMNACEVSMDQRYSFALALLRQMDLQPSLQIRHVY